MRRTGAKVITTTPLAISSNSCENRAYMSAVLFVLSILFKTVFLAPALGILFGAATLLIANTNMLPSGGINASANCGEFFGWAQDKDTPNKTVNVNFFVDSSSGAAAHAGIVAADEYRSSLCSALGSCNHGFSYSVPVTYKDSKAHLLYAFAIDPTTLERAALNNSPISFRCAAPTQVPPPSQPLTLNPLGIRQLNGTPEFFDTVTGKTFIPRGNNYVRLDDIPDPWGGTAFTHSLFYPGKYNANQSNTALTNMSANGYNVVRVFVDSVHSVANTSGPGINPAYMQNVASFLTLAKKHNLYVIITADGIPRNGGYYPTAPKPLSIDGNNVVYLTQPYIDAKKRYLQDFIAALKNANAPMDTLFAWEVENEPYFEENNKPLSLNHGNVTTANGGTYDMSDATSRQNMMDAGMANYISQIAAAAKASDPSHFVTASFFSPAIVAGSDPRTIRTRWMIADPAQGGVAGIDFVDLHLYPGYVPQSQELNSFDITPSHKPLLFGEIGIHFPPNPATYTSAVLAADALKSLQVQSCNSYRFKGWITYTWDTTETKSGARDYYTALDGNGAIREVLSPLTRPNPCK
jgi:hypothetical protein